MGAPSSIRAGGVIGGSSSINGLIYIRGQPEDYDHWAQLGNRGWSWDDCLPFFRKAERWEGEGNAVRGKDGTAVHLEMDRLAHLRDSDRGWQAARPRIP